MAYWYLTSAEGRLAAAVAPQASPDDGETACGFNAGRQCMRPAGHVGAHATYCTRLDGARELVTVWDVPLSQTLAALVPSTRGV